MSPRLLVTLIVGGALAAGCGPASSAKSRTGPPPQHNQAVIAESAAATQSAGTARLAYTMTMSGLGQAGELEVKGGGVMAFHDRVAQISLHMTSAQTGLSLDMTERMIESSFYMRSPFFAGAIGTPWVKLDLQRIGKLQGFDMNALMSTSRADPTQMLTYLEAASDSIERRGADTVRGVATTHYRVVLDFLKVADAAPAAQRAALRRAMAKEVRLLGTHTLPVDVWIDGSGLVRRERLDIPLRAPSVPAGASMTMTMDLFDFGVPVHVQAPPSGDVTDITDTVAASQ